MNTAPSQMAESNVTPSTIALDLEANRWKPKADCSIQIFTTRRRYRFLGYDLCISAWQGGLTMTFRVLISLICMVFLPGISSAAAPKSLAGITLGSNLSEIAGKVDMSSALPIWRSEYLSKVSLKAIEGFRSGYVVCGECNEKGRVVRIKMSYEDDSEAFFNQLHSALEKRYGKPVEWRGNPFGTLKIWKWSLKDTDKHTISIIIERYEGDDDSFTPGNSIRLTNSTLVREEKKCYEAKGKEPAQGKSSGVTEAAAPKLDFDWYLPQ